MGHLLRTLQTPVWTALRQTDVFAFSLEAHE
jgi:hypothetical protein